ncbi:MAG: proline dehydrogenase family protein [Candidatus Aenigmarchaeota archaeon]|nr:proline dehydrogenase family protein [Candidatus Aenigmarchaeota archaeon]
MLQRVVRKWIAGEAKEDALAHAARLNKAGIRAMIDFLGEHRKGMVDVIQTVKEYYWLIHDIDKGALEADVSLKPSQIGLDISPRYCLENLERIAFKAGKHGIRVWVDMESARYTDETIRIYLAALGKYKNLGIAIQSNLRRSGKDLGKLLSKGATVRLVKGAYREPESISYKSREEVRQNFSRLMGVLFEEGKYFAIATHDSRLIGQAMELGRPGKFEFQMLMGIMDPKKRALVRKGYRVAEYVPYGKNWAPYAWRRIREKKSNLLLFARSLINI